MQNSLLSEVQFLCYLCPACFCGRAFHINNQCAVNEDYDDLGLFHTVLSEEQGCSEVCVLPVFLVLASVAA